MESYSSWFIGRGYTVRKRRQISLVNIGGGAVTYTFR